MRSVPRYLLEKVIKKSAHESNCLEISSNKIFYPVTSFESGCFEAMTDVAKVSTVAELESALTNPKISEIFVRRDRELNQRNLTSILENHRQGKTLYCGFNIKQ